MNLKFYSLSALLHGTSYGSQDSLILSKLHFKLQDKQKPVYSNTDEFANIASKQVLLTRRKVIWSNSTTSSTELVTYSKVNKKHVFSQRLAVSFPVRLVPTEYAFMIPYLSIQAS